MTKYLLIGFAFLLVLIVSNIKSYRIGEQVSDAAWEKKQVIEVAQAADLTKKLEEAARTKESLAAVQLSNLQDQLSEENDVIKTNNDAIGKLYADIKRLRFDQNALLTKSSSTSTVTVTSAECNGKTETIISPELFDALYSEFGQCDQITNQLTACQEVVTTDREICNSE